MAFAKAIDVFIHKQGNRVTERILYKHGKRLYSVRETVIVREGGGETVTRDASGVMDWMRVMATWPEFNRNGEKANG
jgi:hypothetical protein